MTEPAPPPVRSPQTPSSTSPPAQAAVKRAWWRRRWVTVGEVVGVAALAVAVLGYLDAHHERRQEQADKAAQAKVETARAALVLTGTATADGAKVTISPMRAGQAVQSQRYLFPHEVLDHAMEVSAAQPQIDRAWIEGGLVRWARAQADGAEGEGELPVGVETTYIEDGDTRTDRSTYRLGFRIEHGGLFSGPKVVLEGLSLARRGVPGDLQAAVESRWKAASAHGLAKAG